VSSREYSLPDAPKSPSANQLYDRTLQGQLKELLQTIQDLPLCSRIIVRDFVRIFDVIQGSDGSESLLEWTFNPIQLILTFDGFVHTLRYTGFAEPIQSLNSRSYIAELQPEDHSSSDGVKYSVLLRPVPPTPPPSLLSPASSIVTPNISPRSEISPSLKKTPSFSFAEASGEPPAATVSFSAWMEEMCKPLMIYFESYDAATSFVSAVEDIHHLTTIEQLGDDLPIPWAKSLRSKLYRENQGILSAVHEEENFENILHVDIAYDDLSIAFSSLTLHPQDSNSASEEDELTENLVKNIFPESPQRLHDRVEDLDEEKERSPLAIEKHISSSLTRVFELQEDEHHDQESVSMESKDDSNSKNQFDEALVDAISLSKDNHVNEDSIEAFEEDIDESRDATEKDADPMSSVVDSDSQPTEVFASSSESAVEEIKLDVNAHDVADPIIEDSIVEIEVPPVDIIADEEASVIEEQAKPSTQMVWIAEDELQSAAESLVEEGVADKLAGIETQLIHDETEIITDIAVDEISDSLDNAVVLDEASDAEMTSDMIHDEQPQTVPTEASPSLSLEAVSAASLKNDAIANILPFYPDDSASNDQGISVGMLQDSMIENSSPRDQQGLLISDHHDADIHESYDSILDFNESMMMAADLVYQNGDSSYTLNESFFNSNDISAYQEMNAALASLNLESHEEFAKLLEEYNIFEEDEDGHYHSDDEEEQTDTAQPAEELAAASSGSTTSSADTSSANEDSSPVRRRRRSLFLTAEGKKVTMSMAALRYQKTLQDAIFAATAAANGQIPGSFGPNYKPPKRLIPSDIDPSAPFAKKDSRTVRNYREGLEKEREKTLARVTSLRSHHAAMSRFLQQFKTANTNASDPASASNIKSADQSPQLPQQPQDK
jgi:hypothetical protein